MKNLISLLIAFLVLGCTSLVLADSVSPTYTLMNTNTGNKSLKAQTMLVLKVVKAKKILAPIQHHRYHKRHHVRHHGRAYYKRAIRTLNKQIKSNYRQIEVLKARRKHFRNLLNITSRQKKLSKANARLTNGRLPIGGHLTYRSYQITDTPLKQKDNTESSVSRHISPLDKWLDDTFPDHYDPLLLPKSIGLGVLVCFVPMFTIFYLMWGSILPLKKIFGSPKPKRPVLAS